MLILFFLVGLLEVIQCQDHYMEEIHKLQDLVNSGRSRPSRSNKPKPKKYKCFLVDEDDFTFSDYATANPYTTTEPTTQIAFDNLWSFRDEEYKVQLPSVYKEPLAPPRHPSQDSAKPPIVRHLPTPQLIDESRKFVPQPIRQFEEAQQFSRSLQPLPTPPPTERPPTSTTEAPQPLPIAPAPSPSLQPAPPKVPDNVPRDSQGRPLILSPEHCAMMKRYADLYGVTDIKGWVHNNCAFAKMYLPTATCPEIDILVGSCGY